MIYNDVVLPQEFDCFKFTLDSLGAVEVHLLPDSALVVGLV